MRCSKCRAENLDDARFCEACGTPLEAPCPSCGTRNRPAARFCRKCRAPLGESVDSASPASYTPRHLASKILTSRSAVEGERKQVTVLFADVRGSLELAEQVDPEEWHSIMERFFAILTQHVHRFEGTINQYTGDGIMALFGAPIAHEDHAQRACFAALSMRDDLRLYADELRMRRGFNFSVRMGMNSGEVVVGKIGDDLRMDYTAQGHAVGLAARMEQLAQPGTVLLTANTGRLVAGYFALRDLGVSSVKGVSDPLHVFELEGLGSLATRFDLSRARGLSRFVGRGRETGLLEAALARTLAGEGRIVGIVAEAGSGKSRLCHEFAQRCRSRGIEVLTASAVPQGQSAPFQPVLQILRGLCGVGERDGAEQARTKVAGALLLRDEKFRDDLPFLFEFLGIAESTQPRPRMEPELVQRRLFGVIRKLIGTRQQAGPAVLVFEDLQWMDGASSAALKDLVEAVPATRTLLLVNFRPEYQAAWMQSANYQRVALEPLSHEAVTALLAELLGPDPSLTELAARIQTRAGGNPFFVEEIVQTLIESGSLEGARGAHRAARAVTDALLPPTVQAALSARIDRLSELEKDVLQAAAVIGTDFAESLLQRVAERPEIDVAGALGALVDAGFMVEILSGAEPAFEFKHPLTQEVAYRSQLGERRTRLHARAARAIEALSADRLDEQAAILAEHWERAGDALVAARWHQRAAAWVSLRDRGEMLRHWQRVRALLDSVPRTGDTLRTRVDARVQILHNSLFLNRVGGDSEVVFREGMELASELGDPILPVWLLAEYGMAQLQVGALDKANTLVRDALRRAGAALDPVLDLAIHVALVWVLLQSGKLHEAVQASDEAERLSGGDPDVGAPLLRFSPWGSILCLRAAALAFLGRTEEATAAIDRAVAIGERRGDVEVLAWAHSWGVQVSWISGDFARAALHGERAIEVAEIAGSVGIRAACFVARARALLLNERPAEAAEALARARALFGLADTDTVIEPTYTSAVARAALALGDLERARTVAEEAVRRAGESPSIEVDARLTRAQVLASIDPHARDQVDADLARASELVESMHARGLARLVEEASQVTRMV